MSTYSKGSPILDEQSLEEKENRNKLAFVPNRIHHIAEVYDSLVCFFNKDSSCRFDLLDPHLKKQVELQNASKLRKIRNEILLKYSTEETKQNISAGNLDFNSIFFKDLKSLSEEEESEIFKVYLIESVSRVFDEYSSKRRAAHAKLLKECNDSTYNACVFEWRGFRISQHYPKYISSLTYDLINKSSQNSFVLHETQKKLQKKLAARQVGPFEDEKLYPFYRDKIGSDLKQIDKRYKEKCAHQLNHLRLCAFAAKKLEKNIDQLSETDLKSCREAFNKLKLPGWIDAEAPARRTKVVKRKSKKRVSKKSRKSNKIVTKEPQQASVVHAPPEKPAAPSLSEMQKTINPLNRSLKTSEFRVHNRVLRWQHCDEEGFERDRHNLAAMVHLIDDRDLCEQLSAPYTWRNERNEVQGGRAFFAEMIKGDDKKFGCINVAIGRDKVIFHSMWSELQQENPLLELQNSFQEGLNDLFPAEEIGWENVSDYHFELSQDGKNFELHVGKVNPVIFRFHGLSPV